MLTQAQLQAQIDAAFEQLSETQLQALAARLLRIKLRADAGSLSPLEAGIEQIKELLEICPSPACSQLVSALEAFNEGDDAELRFLIQEG